MAEKTPFFMDINNVYSGDEFGLPYRDIMGEGIVGAADMLVTAGTGNSINIAAGACWVTGDTDVINQPTYRIINDAVVNKGITPDPTNPRIIRVVMQITDATFAGVTRQGALTAIHGTPAASPVAPALPASAMLICDVTVPAAAASSAAYTFTDQRVRAGVGGGQALLGGGPWVAYTPVWSSGGTAPSLGNGTLVGKYIQIGKTVIGRALLTMGSTTTYGTGVYAFSLPVAAQAAAYPFGVGSVIGTDTGVAAYGAITYLVSSTGIQFYGLGAASLAAWTNLVPFTWGTGDVLACVFEYEAA